MHAIMMLGSSPFLTAISRPDAGAACEKQQSLLIALCSEREKWPENPIKLAQTIIQSLDDICQIAPQVVRGFSLRYQNRMVEELGSNLKRLSDSINGIFLELSQGPLKILESRSNLSASLKSDPALSEAAIKLINYGQTFLKGRASFREQPLQDFINTILELHGFTLDKHPYKKLDECQKAEFAVAYVPREIQRLALFHKFTEDPYLSLSDVRLEVIEAFNVLKNRSMYLQSILTAEQNNPLPETFAGRIKALEDFYTQSPMQEALRDRTAGIPLSSRDPQSVKIFEFRSILDRFNFLKTQLDGIDPEFFNPEIKGKIIEAVRGAVANVKQERHQEEFRTQKKRWDEALSNPLSAGSHSLTIAYFNATEEQRDQVCSVLLEVLPARGFFDRWIPWRRSHTSNAQRDTLRDLVGIDLQKFYKAVEDPQTCGQAYSHISRALVVVKHIDPKYFGVVIDDISESIRRARPELNAAIKWFRQQEENKFKQFNRLKSGNQEQVRDLLRTLNCNLQTLLAQ